jgi:chromosome segregation ATPase
MRLQQYIARVEELKALVDLYEQMSGKYAQVSAYQASTAANPDVTEEQRTQLAASVTQLGTQRAALETLLTERTGASDIDTAIERFHAHLARLETYSNIRREQLQMRTSLDLELHLGTVPPETRQQAETSLDDMQTRLDGLLVLAEKSLPAPRVVLLS